MLSVQQLAKMIDHTLLKPYIQGLVKYNAETGVGAVRPLFFYYDEERSYKESYEYLLGRDILVAPVIRKGAALRQVWLPDDEWVELFTGRQLGGGLYVVEAPMGKIPVYYRKNADPALLEIMNKIKDI